METSILRQWLKAGFMEQSLWQDTEAGTPQGAIVTPLTQRKHLFDGKDMADGNFFCNRIHHDFFDQKPNDLLRSTKPNVERLVVIRWVKDANCSISCKR